MTLRDRLATLSIDAQIAAVRARKIADRYDDTYARFECEANAADDNHQRKREGE